MEIPKERIHWIDMLKGICMIAILLFHTEYYYNGGAEIISYNLYVCNALAIFFFLSGYHFYKNSFNNHELQKNFFIRKLKSIAKGIILPYFIFTSVIALPKAIVHGTIINITDILTNIISGNVSWFVAALIVAELLFSTLLYICKWKNSLLCTAAVFSFAISIWLSTTEITLWWQIDNACMAFSYLYLGFLYHQKEKFFNRINNIYYTSFLLLILIILKIYIMYEGISLIMNPIMISNVPVFISDSLVSILLMIGISKLLPKNRMIEWTGAHSLIYYFFCGGVPLIVSMVFNKIGFQYDGEYYRVILAFLMVYAATSLIAWLIYNYLPFTVGKWKETKTI